MYNFADLRMLHSIETLSNPSGLLALSAEASNTVLACPGLHQGEVGPARSAYLTWLSGYGRKPDAACSALAGACSQPLADDQLAQCPRTSKRISMILLHKTFLLAAMLQASSGRCAGLLPSCSLCKAGARTWRWPCRDA